MSDIFLPEGRLLNTPENCRQCASAAGLRRAMERQTILEGTALMAKPDLTLRVAVGPYIGEIPREETAEGIGPVAVGVQLDPIAHFPYFPDKIRQVRLQGGFSSGNADTF